MTTLTDDMIEIIAQTLAAKALRYRDESLDWRDAGYRTAEAAAAAMIGDGGDDAVRARAIEIVADAL